MVWIAIGAMALSVLALLVWPIFSQARRTGGGSANDAVDEIDYLAAQAAVDGDADARQRLLSAHRATKKALKSAPAADTATRLRGMAIILAGAAPMAAVAIYLALGRPDYSSADETSIAGAAMSVSQADATSAIAQMPVGERMAMIENMVDGLAARLAENPADAEGWQMLARSYDVLGRNDESVSALESALTNFPDNIDIRLAYAQSLLSRRVSADTPIGANETAAFEAVLALNENQPLALFILGESARLSGDASTAERYWKRLLLVIPPGTPQSAQLLEMIDQLE